MGSSVKPILPCTGLMDLFFSDEAPEIAEAKDICHICPYRARCLQKALDRDEPEGVWGGYAPIERRWWRLEYGDHVADPVPPLSIKLFSASR